MASVIDHLGSKFHGIFTQAFRAVGATFNATEGEKLRNVCTNLARVIFKLVVTSMNELQDNVEEEFKTVNNLTN